MLQRGGGDKPPPRDGGPPTDGGSEGGDRPPRPSDGGMGGGSRDPLGTAAGIALTGAYIFNALGGGNVDAVETEVTTLDVCLSHPTPSN